MYPKLVAQRSDSPQVLEKLLEIAEKAYNDKKVSEFQRFYIIRQIKNSLMN